MRSVAKRLSDALSAGAPSIGATLDERRETGFDGGDDGFRHGPEGVRASGEADGVGVDVGRFLPCIATKIRLSARDRAEPRLPGRPAPRFA